MGEGDGGERVMALGAEVANVTRQVVVAMGVEGVGDGGVVGRELLAGWMAVQRPGAGDGGGRDAEQVAGEKGEGIVVDEDGGGDEMEGEESGSAADAGLAKAREVIGAAGVEGEVGIGAETVVTREGVGKDGLGAAAGDVAEVGNGGSAGGGAEEEGGDGVV